MNYVPPTPALAEAIKAARRSINVNKGVAPAGAPAATATNPNTGAPYQIGTGHHGEVTLLVCSAGWQVETVYARRDMPLDITKERRRVFPSTRPGATGAIISSAGDSLIFDGAAAAWCVSASMTILGRTRTEGYDVICANQLRRRVLDKIEDKPLPEELERIARPALIKQAAEALASAYRPGMGPSPGGKRRGCQLQVWTYASSGTTILRLTGWDTGDRPAVNLIGYIDPDAGVCLMGEDCPEWVCKRLETGTRGAPKRARITGAGAGRRGRVDGNRSQERLQASFYRKLAREMAYQIKNPPPPRRKRGQVLLARDPAPALSSPRGRPGPPKTPAELERDTFKIRYTLPWTYNRFGVPDPAPPEVEIAGDKGTKGEALNLAVSRIRSTKLTHCIQPWAAREKETDQVEWGFPYFPTSDGSFRGMPKGAILSVWATADGHPPRWTITAIYTNLMGRDAEYDRDPRRIRTMGQSPGWEDDSDRGPTLFAEEAISADGRRTDELVDRIIRSLLKQERALNKVY